MHTSRTIRNAGTINIYLLFCNPVKIYEVWSIFLLGQSLSTILPHLSHLQALRNLELWHFGPDTRAFFRLNITQQLNGFSNSRHNLRLKKPWEGETSLHHPNFPSLSDVSVRNYLSPSRQWRLSFRVGDHQLATWSPKKKKKKKKKKNRAVANLSQRRRADREQAFFLPFFHFRGFGLIENETRIAKLPLVTRRPTRGATDRAVQCRACAACAFHTCGCKIDNKETTLHHVPIHIDLGTRKQI